MAKERCAYLDIEIKIYFYRIYVKDADITMHTLNTKCMIQVLNIYI